MAPYQDLPGIFYAENEGTFSHRKSRQRAAALEST